MFRAGARSTAVRCLYPAHSRPRRTGFALAVLDPRMENNVAISHPLNFEIAGVDAEVGKLLPIEEWAERAQIPRPRGGVAAGRAVRSLLGVESKSFDVTRFSDLNVVADTM